MTTCDSLAVRSGSRRAVRFNVMGMLLVVASVLAVSSSALAQTTTLCGPEVKEEAAKALAAIDGASATEKPALEAALYAKYQFCLQDSQFVPATFIAAARECGATVSNAGSLFYEEMSCVGYDPQRRQFAAPIKIKQVFGFGAFPLPGSREYVLHCVADAANVLRPVGHDSVHVADEALGQAPTWQFAVIADANDNLPTVYPMDGQTRRARSILSWGFAPNNNCNFQPIWGNALNYRIRLNQ
jgi:hypothetical protein